MNPNPAIARQRLTDRLQRPIQDLRISLTDRCTFRCRYCMPKEVFGPNFAFMKTEEIMADDEIVRLARIFSTLGVGKIRLTGGEPLLRPGLPALVKRLSGLPGINDISLTTNGSLLTQELAQALREAGLRRINISLDGLDDATFMALNDVAFPVHKVLDAVKAAEFAGLDPVKINMVVIRGVNDHNVVDVARYFRGTGHIVRFIEYMDVGNTNGWRLDQVLTADEIMGLINSHYPLQPLAPNRSGEVADRYAYLDGRGEIGIIASVTRPFCHGCTRARLSADGRLFLCLFGETGYDLRSHLQNGESDEEIAVQISKIWSSRDDRYSELRSSWTGKTSKVEMSRIGG